MVYQKICSWIELHYSFHSIKYIFPWQRQKHVVKVLCMQQHDFPMSSALYVCYLQQEDLVIICGEQLITLAMAFVVCEFLVNTMANNSIWCKAFHLMTGLGLPHSLAISLTSSWCMHILWETYNVLVFDTTTVITLKFIWPSPYSLSYHPLSSLSHLCGFIPAPGYF